jgi:hypothetical protein
MNVQTRRSMAPGLLIALFLLAGSAVLQGMRTAAADTPVPGTPAPVARNECRGVDSKLAREQADAAFRKARYHEAAQCYLIAGDKPRADLAFLKAAAADNADTKRQLAANANQVKEQFRQLREAFTSH